MAKYSHISDIDINLTANIDSSNILPLVRHLDENELNPEPPPTPTPQAIQVENVSELECKYDAQFPVGESFHAHITCPAAERPATIDNSHHLWDIFMFPAHEQDDRSISPATILQLLATYDATTFTTPLSPSFAKMHHLRHGI